MNIYMLNKSTVLSDEQIQAWLPAFNKFVDHVRYYWPRPAHLIWCPKEHEPVEAWKVVFLDDSDQAGALAYHGLTPGGKPISSVFARTEMKNGYSVTVSACHEIAEMIADPWIADAVQVSNQYFYAKEICDPVESDSDGYEISVPGFEPVLCSNFVTPYWFSPGEVDGVLDHCRKLTKPLELLKGGYMSVCPVGRGGWTPIYAEEQGYGKPALGLHTTKFTGGYGRLERYGRERGDHPTVF